MDDRVILRVGAKMLTPFILIFALYVQFHGDYGPGGGFQAGVIFAAAFVLHARVLDLTGHVHRGRYDAHLTECDGFRSRSLERSD